MKKMLLSFVFLMSSFVYSGNRQAKVEKLLNQAQGSISFVEQQFATSQIQDSCDKKNIQSWISSYKALKKARRRAKKAFKKGVKLANRELLDQAADSKAKIEKLQDRLLSMNCAKKAKSVMRRATVKKFFLA